jgi:hypothetical protein
VYSLIWPSATARAAHESKRAAKIAEKEKWAHLERSPVENEMTAEEQWQHMWELQQLPRTPGTTNGMRSPMTPRTQAFGDLDGNNQGWYATTPVATQEQARGLGVQHGGYEVQSQQQYGEYPTPQPQAAYPVPQANGQYPAPQDVDEYVPDRKTGSAY